MYHTSPPSSSHVSKSQSQSASSPVAAGNKDDIDSILNMFNSPSMQSGLVLSPYKPSSSNYIFSPEQAKHSNAQAFTQFGSTVNSLAVNRERAENLSSACSETSSNKSVNGLTSTTVSVSAGSYATSAKQQATKTAATGGLDVDPALRPFEQKIAPSPSSSFKTRCSRVVVAGSSLPRGLKASAFSKAACDCLLCVHCNFRVISFPDHAWHESMDYMFARNNMPSTIKLSAKLVGAKGSVAYCCQCAWLSEANERILLQGMPTDPQWVCTGH
jgi:hypothetical protein